MAQAIPYLRTIARATIVAILGAAVVAGVAFSATNFNVVKPGDPSNRQGRQITLRDQLRTGLKAFTPDDLAFIDLVVAKVDQGVLSRTLVDSTFLWARRRVSTYGANYSKRPMVYFKPALIARAKAAGVIL